eukprot:3602604-Pleurochrysis_carterae.AAC.1
MAALASSHLRRLSQGLERAISGIDSRAPPHHALQQARGIYLSYSHVCFRALFASPEPCCVLMSSIRRRMP